jgi:hypothetical protein
MVYKRKKGRSPKFRSPKKDLHHRFEGGVLTIGSSEYRSDLSIYMQVVVSVDLMIVHNFRVQRLGELGCVGAQTSEA